MIKKEDIGQVYYNAILARDTSFEGVFFTAVKTTGIFCRPSCGARKPKFENVEFFETTRECILRGYRPCKVCHPLEKLNQTPSVYQSLIDELSRDPSLKFKDTDLRKKGIEPSHIRRWFTKNHGMTFQAYQRMYRINAAFKRIQNGETVIRSAIDSGFESLSGFNDRFKSIFGVSPRKGRSRLIIDLKRIETPLGTMIACATGQGICLLEFTDRRMLETELKSVATLLNATIIQGQNALFEVLEKELQDYFAGKRKEFSVPLHSPGTPFQKMAWSNLRKIPYGETRTYKEQAEAMKCPDSIRAVAHANGMNRLAILIPCHRVIGKNGKLTGYGGGLWRKQFLLDLEKRNLHSHNSTL